LPTYTPNDLSIADFQFLMQGAVAPRPIAFASTINAKGQVNLSPFSYFNAFSSNPPVLIFSPARRVRDNTTKHTLENVLEVPECVINVVSYAMVEQMSLASTEYAQGVNEFEKAGFTEQASSLVKPPRVAESPAQFECKVIEVKALGEGPGAGNLIICEVLAMHIADEVLEANGKFVDPQKIDLVSRLGGAWYGRASGDALFQIPKPLKTQGIGIDQLPASIKNSKILTGNQLARLANVEVVPERNEDVLRSLAFSSSSSEEDIHRRIANLLDQGKLDEAWQLVLIC
jgi:flavin reductase (DIM6/NTAB) family NADH-FMN oxidoreductase RutF